MLWPALCKNWFLYIESIFFLFPFNSNDADSTEIEKYLFSFIGECSPKKDCLMRH